MGTGLFCTTKKKTAPTIIKDYEVRIECLKKRLNEITVERNFFEDNLNRIEKDAQQMFIKYVTDLEKERLEANKLKKIIEKQDELISRLESRITDKDDDLLLKEQVQLQSIELQNKRKLLSQLLNERNSLLCKLSMRPISYNRSITPPSSPPPKHPLPPLPATSLE